MNLRLILDLVIALPKVAGLVFSIFKSIQQFREAQRNNRFNEAIDRLSSMDDKNEIKKQNENIARNLP